MQRRALLLFATYLIIASSPASYRGVTPRKSLSYCKLSVSCANALQAPRLISSVSLGSEGKTTVAVFHQEAPTREARTRLPISQGESNFLSISAFNSSFEISSGTLSTLIVSGPLVGRLVLTDCSRLIFLSARLMTRFLTSLGQHSFHSGSVTILVCQLTDLCCGLKQKGGHFLLVQ